MRCGAEGDPKRKVPRGMLRAWMPTKAGPFSRLDARSSMAFDYDRLIDPRGDPVGQLDATQRGRAITAHKQPEVAVLSVAAVRKVLALHDLLHDVICVDPSVIHPGRVTLHGVLLPPK